MVQTAGFLLAGIWSGWCVMILRDDLTIAESRGWRKGRAIFFAVLAAVFMIALALRDFSHFVWFTSSMSASSALFLLRSRRQKDRP